MSLNGVADLYPNTLSGLSTFNANQILINGVDISTIYVPFINSPSDVDLASKNLTTTGRVQATVLKLPSLTQSSTKFLQLDANKEVISTDLTTTFVVYTGATNNLDMGVFRVFTTAVPSFNNELVNKLYVDTTFPNFAYLSANYLTQANASIIYAPIASPTFTGTVSGITSSMVGLGNVDNTSDLNKPVSTATQTALNLKADLASPTFTGTVSGITSSMVGLGNVDNTSDLNKPVSTATQTALNLKADLASPTFTGTVSGITSTMVGLGNVDNTSDLNKPVSTATQTALNLKSDLASPTFTGTVTLPSVSFTSTPASGTGTLLAINGSNQIITTASSINQTATSTAGTYYLPFVASASTGAFVPLVNSGITCNPSTGLIQCNNITSSNFMQAFNMKIVNVNAGAGTLRPLAVDATGQVVQDNAITPLQQTRTSTNATFYVPFVSSFTTGTFTPLIENKLLFNPATGLLTTNLLQIYGNANVGSLTFSTNPATGTVAFYLAIDSTGVVIRTGAAGGDAYLANTQTFTGDNTFSGIVYASRIYAQNTGAVMEYDTRSNYAHQFKVNGTVLAQIGTLGLAVNNIVNLNAVNLVINGNGSGVIVLQASGTTMATIDGTGFNTNQINTYANADLNINVVDATKFTNFTFNGARKFAATNSGTWMPADGTTSFYITDVPPNTSTTGNYGRYFGGGGAIYQDYYNSFNWRRASNANGSGLADIMALDGNGLTLFNSVNAGHPQIVFAGSGTPLIKCTGVGLNWFVNSGDQLGFFDLHAGHWRIGTAGGKKLILCAGTANTLQIGTGSLGQYPVEIYGYKVVSGAYWYYLGGSANWAVAGTLSIAVGLYVQYAINADGGYIIASDERIKKNIKPAESGSLAVIKTIPIKSYEHIDPFVHGCATAFNVTAQDLKNTYPEAVTNSSGYIPDMYVKCRWIHVDEKQIEINIPKPHTVIVGDKVKLILEDSTHREAIVTAIKDDNTFAVEKWEEFKLEVSDEMFVYGKHIDDFLRVDKIKLGVLALAGVKELNQIVETQQHQIQAQQAKIEEQSLAINTLTESMKFLTEHLAKLTTAFNEIVKEK
jgi:hypothetical protein